jgi:hypothetical protein
MCFLQKLKVCLQEQGFSRGSVSRSAAQHTDRIGSNCVTVHHLTLSDMKIPVRVNRPLMSGGNTFCLVYFYTRKIGLK